MAFLGRESDAGLRPAVRDTSRTISCPDGGWAIYPGGPTDVSASVKAYFALKLTGRSPDEPGDGRGRAGRSSRPAVPTQCNSFTRFYLALLGQIGYDECPCVPPELVLIPPRLELQPERDVGLDADDRRAAVDHVVLQAGAVAARPSRASPSCSATTAAGRRGGRPAGSPGPTSSWGSTACSSGSIAGCPPPGGSRRSGRRIAGCSSTARTPTAWVRSSRRWSTRSSRCDAWVTTLDSPDGPVGDRAARRPADRRGRPGPRAALPLAGLGHGDRHDRAGRRRAARRPSRPGTGAVDWLLAKEVRHPGDWADPPARASSRPAGTSSSATRSIPTSTTARWCCWPSTGRRWPTTRPSQAATRRGVDWLLSMQNRDGGWAAYDVDIDNQVLTKLPFADHNAMLDPSCADITARVLELLGTLGYRADHPAVAPRARLPLEHPGARGLLVRPLGRQLHLRHLAGLAGPGGHRLPDGSPGDPAGRRLARIDPAALGRLGRDLPELRRPVAQGDRRADALADGLGHARARSPPAVPRPPPSAAASIT